jgi:hypothetical protein
MAEVASLSPESPQPDELDPIYEPSNNEAYASAESPVAAGGGGNASNRGRKRRSGVDSNK